MHFYEKELLERMNSGDQRGYHLGWTKRSYQLARIYKTT